jgi:hypothetical protein
MTGDVFSPHTHTLYTVVNHHLYSRPATPDYYEWTQVSDAYGMNALAMGGDRLWGVAFEAKLYQRRPWESTWWDTTDARGIKTMTAAHAGLAGDLLFAQSGNLLWFRSAWDLTSKGWQRASGLENDAYGIRALTTQPSTPPSKSTPQLLIGVTDGTTPTGPSRFWTRPALVGDEGFATSWTSRPNFAPPTDPGHHVVALASSLSLR